jgi:hypothetical protein
MSEYQDSLQSLNTALVQKVSETQGKRQGKQEVNRKVSDATVLGDKLQQLQMEQRTSSIAKKSIASAYKKLSKKVSSSMKSRDRHRDDQENESPFARSRSNSVVSDISSLSERARKQHASVPAVLIASQDLYLQSNQLHTSTEHTMTRIHQVHEDVRSGALPRMLVAHIQQLRKFYQDGLVCEWISANFFVLLKQPFNNLSREFLTICWQNLNWSLWIHFCANVNRL